jgi:hypothetical protein
MKGTAFQDAGTAQRGELKAPFFQIGGEIYDVFLPIIGADCLAVYLYFPRRKFIDHKLKHTVRGLAEAADLGVATVSRSLEVLEKLQLVKLTRFGGSKESECQLLDSNEAAVQLGAKYHPRTCSFSLPPKVAQRLKAEVKALREKQQRKSSPIVLNRVPHDCGNPILPVSQRNASVPPEKRKRGPIHY